MKDIIFVFGSNLAGRHGAGAALHAKKYYGAEHGVGVGMTGRSYAIPTKDENLKTRSMYDIAVSINDFLNFAKAEGKDMTFLLTPVGCGLAGYDAANFWALLQELGLPNNVLLAPQWVNDHRIIR